MFNKWISSYEKGPKICKKRQMNIIKNSKSYNND